MHRALVLFVLAFGPFTSATPILAADAFDLGARFDLLVGDGEPTNDVLGYSLFGRWHFNERWSLELVAGHSPEFDVERTPELLGIVQDSALEVIDSKASSTTVQIYLERQYQRARTEWFWRLGGGISSVDVDPVSGRTDTGRNFVIDTDAGTSPVLGLVGGLRVRLGQDWALEMALRAENHFADWELRDTTTGATAAVSDFLLTGIHLGLGYRF